MIYHLGEQVYILESSQYSQIACFRHVPSDEENLALFYLWRHPGKPFPPPSRHTLEPAVSLWLLSITARVHSPPRFPVASTGQRGDQWDEGVEGTQREHASQYLTQPRGPPLPGERQRQWGETRSVVSGEQYGVQLITLILSPRKILLHSWEV